MFCVIDKKVLFHLHSILSNSAKWSHQWECRDSHICKGEFRLMFDMAEWRKSLESDTKMPNRTYRAMPDCSLGKSTDTEQLLHNCSQHHQFIFNIFFCVLPYHIISVECEREKYSFLITLVHFNSRKGKERKSVLMVICQNINAPTLQ